jgi:hypothetical protein
MADQQPKNLPKPSYLEGYRLYRERILAEDQLIHYRTSWSIWIQTLLVIILGALAVNIKTAQCAEKVEQLFVQLIYGLCAVGAIAALFSCVSIIVALVEIYRLKTRYEEHYRDHRIVAPWLPNITASTSLHIFGHGVNTVGPLVAVVAWVVLAVEIYLRCH